MSRNTVAEALAAQMLQEQDALLSRLESASSKLDKAAETSTERLEKMTSALERGADEFRGAVNQFVDIAKKEIEESATGAAKRSIVATAHEQQESLKEFTAEAFNTKAFNELRQLSESFHRFKKNQHAERLRILWLAFAVSLLSGITSAVLVSIIP